MNFNPLSLCRERRVFNVPPDKSIVFQSTLSLQRETTLIQALRSNVSFQSTLSLQRETVQKILRGEVVDISIHSLFAERDFPTTPVKAHLRIFQSTLSLQRETTETDRIITALIISIHSLFAERDDTCMYWEARYEYFNPLSLCRERRGEERICCAEKNFNPLSLCRERLPEPYKEV